MACGKKQKKTHLVGQMGFFNNGELTRTLLIIGGKLVSPSPTMDNTPSILNS